MSPCLSCSLLRKRGDCNNNQCEVFLQLIEECKKNNIPFDLDMLDEYLHVEDYFNEADDTFEDLSETML